ncbi:MAG TPA: hypothetical protein VFC17_06325 [Candidatus Limnocylindrales bacterium]|nr:hypothetical protein [Candidatus Limnocylindrales bacterium]
MNRYVLQLESAYTNPCPAYVPRYGDMLAADGFPTSQKMPNNPQPSVSRVAGNRRF